MTETLLSAAGLPVFVGGKPVEWFLGDQAVYRRLCNRPPFETYPCPAFFLGFEDPDAPCPFRLPGAKAAQFFAGQTVARRFRDRVAAEDAGALP